MNDSTEIQKRISRIWQEKESLIHQLEQKEWASAEKWSLLSKPMLDDVSFEASPDVNFIDSPAVKRAYGKERAEEIMKNGLHMYEGQDVTVRDGISKDS